MTADAASISFDEFARLFEPCGGTDGVYLRDHFARFAYTLREFSSTWDGKGRRLLDVGGGWMHQAVLFRQAGFEVTSADIATMIWEPAKAAARVHGFRILPFASLAAPVEIESLPPDSFDVILFSEIIEHITFNPVRMWKALYRVLAPGGRIVVSTPSYYSLQGRFWDPARLAARMGGGLLVDEILLVHDTAPHWKEYSMRELHRYFRLLSPDFRIAKSLHVDGLYPEPWTGARRAAARVLKRHVPPLRQNLHVEVELAAKSAGIAIEPGWHWPKADYRVP